MTRITIKDLRNLCDYLNKVTDSPSTPYTRTEQGVKANIGNYHIYQAYGGYCLHQIVNEGGGVTTPLGGGCIPARELYNNMQSFISGIKYNKGV